MALSDDLTAAQTALANAQTALTAANAAVAQAIIDATNPPPPPPPPPSIGIIVKPGVGSFTDSQNGVWTLTPAGHAQVNGQDVPGGAGTSELVYIFASKLVYGQDASTHNWFTHINNGWAPSGAPPIS